MCICILINGGTFKNNHIGVVAINFTEVANKVRRTVVTSHCDHNMEDFERNEYY